MRLPEYNEEQLAFLQNYFKNVSRTPNPKQLTDVCYELNKISEKNKHDMKKKGLKSLQMWFDLQRLSTPKRRKSLTAMQKGDRQQFRQRLTKSTSSDGVGSLEAYKKLSLKSESVSSELHNLSPAKRSKIPIRKLRSQTTPESGYLVKVKPIHHKPSLKPKNPPRSPVVLTRVAKVPHVTESQGSMQLLRYVSLIFDHRN